LADLHTSRVASHFLRCGHSMHGTCYTSYARTNIACPLCRKSICDPKFFASWFEAQIASTIMPLEYRNKYMSVACNDCNHKSLVKFHIVGGKCEKCDSWNTSRVGDEL